MAIITANEILKDPIAGCSFTVKDNGMYSTLLDSLKVRLQCVCGMFEDVNEIIADIVVQSTEIGTNPREFVINEMQFEVRKRMVDFTFIYRSEPYEFETLWMKARAEKLFGNAFSDKALDWVNAVRDMRGKRF
jgi:hypothetical protein